MFKWELQASSMAHATTKDVWDIWENVEFWPVWDHELEWSKLDGPFQKGTEGQLKPKGWPASKFKIIAMDEGISHTDITKMPLTSVIFNHVVTPTTNGHVKITHSVQVSGLLAPLLWLTMRFALKKGLPVAVERLAKLAEENTKH